MAERYRTPRREDTKKNEPNACSDHSKELGAFCGTCRELVCIDCIVGDHKGHLIDSVEDVYIKKMVCLARIYYNPKLGCISNAPSFIT